jgi:hypothetical protein
VDFLTALLLAVSNLQRALLPFFPTRRALYQSSSAHLSIVFGSMSEDSVGAIMSLLQRKKESYKLGLHEVCPPVLPLGCCHYRSSRTFHEYIPKVLVLRGAKVIVAD